MLVWTQLQSALKNLAMVPKGSLQLTRMPITKATGDAFSRCILTSTPCVCAQTEAEKTRAGLEQRVQQLESELQAAARTDQSSSGANTLSRSSSHAAADRDSRSHWASKEVQAKLEAAELHMAHMQQENAELKADKYAWQPIAS